MTLYEDVDDITRLGLMSYFLDFRVFEFLPAGPVPQRELGYIPARKT